ncbi:probable plastid-lipid-associated protein 10, chloroplastic [Humulus lupulus]|uniref:probable plastid-lipid-associated protein 10, chloroplastic n=1 Tax=Humulus lupulus TaxID=3486 RepID=UPI002B40F2AA|nr:probable plastid-lipid-associated protein 10, chloroplastic [Humulus lupulus]XP_062110883.1 probable plastid-lipid-associated protein 10, chloroplastic [Humulus lupulus]
MDLAFASPMYLSTGKRTLEKIKPHSSMLTASQKSFPRRLSPCLATLSSQVTQALEFEVENKKHDLLRAVQDTQRGLTTTADQRSLIEEALVSVEGYNRGTPIDLVKLDGTWRLQYTSASDVLILLEAAARLPFFQVGQIYQKFECRDQSRGGIIRNVVRWSIPNLFEEQEGATLLVSAKFDVVSVRNIYLQFEEITVQNIKISEELQALIAPAILPRSFLSLQILQFLRSFKAQFPVTNRALSATDPGRRSIGGLYYLSYLDSNMLLGRSVGGGGVFVFTKAQPLD